MRLLRGRADSLAGRMILASAVLAILVAGIFGVLALAVFNLRAATNKEAKAKEVTAATLALEKLVVDLETGLRGFALTGERGILRPWNEALAELPERLATFERLAASDETQRRRAREIVALIRSYVDEYSLPLVEIARESGPAAQSPVAVQEGKRRTDEIRAGFARFLAAEDARARESARSANDRSEQAVVLGIVGLSGSVALIVLLGLYLARSIAQPVREAAEGATRIARGELEMRLAKRGPGEVGELTRAFNTMAEELAKHERELEEQNEQLRESERLKSELVSIVTHEMRTPLSGLIGFTSVLLDQELDEESRRRYLAIVHGEARRLASLLNDFVDVERLEKGLLPLGREEVDLANVLREQVEIFSAESARHSLALRLPNGRLEVEGDTNRLTQVVTNLLSNAIKYSPEGGRVEVVGERVDGVVRVSVSDEGVGIAGDYQPQIFTKFFRGDAASTGIAGSGLGLAIARAVVEAHGGRIKFTSEPGEGSTFWVDLPARHSQQVKGEKPWGAD